MLPGSAVALILQPACHTGCQPGYGKHWCMPYLYAELVIVLVSSQQHLPSTTDLSKVHAEAAVDEPNNTLKLRLPALLQASQEDKNGHR